MQKNIIYDMKIMKFNESYQTWTKERIQNFCEEEYNFKEGIRSYINWKENVPGDDDSFPYEFHSEVDSLYVEYRNSGGDEKSIDINYEELVNFLNDPDLYTNAKKYNV
jgi:hypothetical protein